MGFASNEFYRSTSGRIETTGAANEGTRYLYFELSGNQQTRLVLSHISAHYKRSTNASGTISTATLVNGLLTIWEGKLDHAGAKAVLPGADTISRPDLDIMQAGSFVANAKLLYSAGFGGNIPFKEINFGDEGLIIATDKPCTVVLSFAVWSDSVSNNVPDNVGTGYATVAGLAVKGYATDKYGKKQNIIFNN